MRKSIVIAALVVMAALGSCSKSNSPVAVAPDVEIDQSQSYFPMKVGYWWQYEYSFSAVPDTVKYFIAGTEVKNGKTYYDYALSDAGNENSSLYCRYENNKMYAFGANQYGLDTAKEYVFMDFNLAVGDSTVILGTYTPKGATESLPQKTVIQRIGGITTFTARNGIVYKDVMVFRTSIYYQSSSSWKLLTTYDDYYSKGVGWVYTYYENNVFIELQDYSFKK